MDKEITEFAEILYNFREALDIKSIKANLESFLLANHYVKLPQNKPPLLSDEEIVKIWFSVEGTAPTNRAIAQAQWDKWNKAIYGGER